MTAVSETLATGTVDSDPYWVHGTTCPATNGTATNA